MKDFTAKKAKKCSDSKARKEEEKEGQRKIDTEVRHLKEEAERRSLGRAMLSDAASNRPSFNTSCLNLLNNFQGKKKIVYSVTN